MLKIIMSTFFLVFIAEIGDKTQLETMMLTAKSHSPLAVFIGSSLALISSSLISVFAGSYILNIIPANYIKIITGLVFILFGFLVLFNKI